MFQRCLAAFAVVALVPVVGGDLPTAGFDWMTFFFEGIYNEGEEAVFELVAIAHCAGLPMLIGGLGAPIAGVACALTGWA